MQEKEWLYGKTLPQLQVISESLGMRRFVAAQIASWLYKKNATQIAQMTDISLSCRDQLESNYEIGLTPFSKESISSDGTCKYLFPTISGDDIETAYIPGSDRATLCVSSQVGCRMGCSFCMTARQGFTRNLSCGEILNQMRSTPNFDKLTNMVYMGMGEPLDNLDEVVKSIDILTSSWGYGWSPTRITLSTVGILPAIKDFMERTKVHLAVSMHNPFHQERMEIVPIEKVYPIADVVDELKRYDFSHQRRVSFEYIVLKGMNDSPMHVRELARLLNGLKCRINLIRFHAIPGSPFVSPGNQAMERFRDALSSKGIVTTIRTSRGEDIQAACGLLSTKK